MKIPSCFLDNSCQERVQLPAKTDVVFDGRSSQDVTVSSALHGIRQPKTCPQTICFRSRITQVPEWSKGEVLRSSAKAPGFEVYECPSLSSLCFDRHSCPGKEVAEEEFGEKQPS